MKKIIFILALLPLLLQGQDTLSLFSPDLSVCLNVIVEENASLYYSISHKDTPVLEKGSFQIDLSWDHARSKKAVIDGKHLSPEVRKTKHREKIHGQFYRKVQVRKDFNQVTMFADDYCIDFCVFNNGVAYRVRSNFEDEQPMLVLSEKDQFLLPEGSKVWVSYVNRKQDKGESFEHYRQRQFASSHENTYVHQLVEEMDSNRLAMIPLLVELPNGNRLAITESDLKHYPGMYLRHGGNNCLVSEFAPFPKHVEQGGHNNLQYLVKETEDFIARVDYDFRYPWRCFMIAETDAKLVENDMVFQLAQAPIKQDYSWIKPGKVAWEWWNAWGLKDVGFKPGVNDRTYKYYIDFAARNGIEYVILDEGWSVNGAADLMQVVPELNLPQLCQYAKEKGVGIVLWAGYAAMDKDMDNVCSHYSEMGVKGFKVDFMDRDDQQAVDFYWQMAQTAAKYHLFVDFHGACKPTGLSRTWPNVLNYEGVYGLENTKWDGTTDFVTHECVLPFTRMLAGPMDYTQGAMVNMQMKKYKSDWNEPMSQGTRCRQLAEYVIFDGPFSMLCDSPTKYEQDESYVKFLASIPTTWDETRVLEGKVGEYIVVARKKGRIWYIAGITDWNKRTIKIDFKSLGISGTKVTQYSDTKSAGNPYKLDHFNATDVKVVMQPGGGFLLQIKQ